MKIKAKTKKVVKKTTKRNPDSKEDLMKELLKIQERQKSLDQEKKVLKKDKGWVVVYSDKDTSIGFGVDVDENKALLKAKKDAKERGPVSSRKSNVIMKIGVL